jgi:hypothetical protein
MRMKAEDGFDLFRGQRCAWPVVSSFRRQDSERQADAVARVNQFINWAKTEAALEQYGFSSGIGPKVLLGAQFFAARC